MIETGLLGFLSRDHLQGPWRIRSLKELPVRDAMMHRRLDVTYCAHRALSPAAQRFINLLVQQCTQSRLEERGS